MDFIARFSANASKSKQATSRKKALEKLAQVAETPAQKPAEAPQPVATKA